MINKHEESVTSDLEQRRQKDHGILAYYHAYPWALRVAEGIQAIRAILD